MVRTGRPLGGTRRTGAQEAAAESGIELTLLSGAIKSWESSREASRKVTLDSLGEIRERELTGLIYIGSAGAFAGRRVLWEHGIRVPEEVGILAHGDDPILQDCTPALSSTRTDFTAMSRDALDILAGNLPRQRERRYPAVIVDRESIPHK